MCTYTIKLLFWNVLELFAITKNELAPGKSNLSSGKRSSGSGFQIYRTRKKEMFACVQHECLQFETDPKLRGIQD